MIKYLILILAIIASVDIEAQQGIYDDTPFVQDKSEYIFAADEFNGDLMKVFTDRNYVTEVLSSSGLLRPSKIALVTQRLYRPMVDMEILDMELYNEEFVYLTKEAILSNAWAGKLQLGYSLKRAVCFAGGSSFDFLIASDNGLHYVSDNGLLWQHSFTAPTEIVDVTYDISLDGFWVLTHGELYYFDISTMEMEEVTKGENFTAFLLLKNSGKLILASSNGYSVYDKMLDKITSTNKKLPCNKLTSVAEINGNLWFGSKNGAFMLKNDGSFNYYASRRWLPNNEVRFISEGENNSVSVLTSKGLATISFKLMTLYDKARLYEKQVRRRHLRNGFNCDTYSMEVPGDLSSGTLVDSDNDGLWTSMYLGSQVFRYAVTHSTDALKNVKSAFDAMERLFLINNIEGFPSRSYERKGFKLHDKDAWHETNDGLWDWKGTTSSDEAIGHYFAFALVAELIDDDAMKQRAINLIDAMTNHIVENDLYFVDFDGKPTRWGRWNPDYVNAFPKSVGDRKLNSSNIIAFLQTAYHFTGKEKYKTKAVELMEEQGYLDNLMRPMEEIGVTGDNSLAKLLSDSWNHSDDEMYFLSYWNLYPYALNNDLKQKFKQTIKNHWNIERPEKDGLWNFCYAMTGADDFDLDESIWFLKEFPLDLINWTIKNSGRNDIELLPQNFRRQTTTHVLPPDERPIFKHNTNTFVLDREGGGRSESSGDLYLLPYWMGRFLGVISAPVE